MPLDLTTTPLRQFVYGAPKTRKTLYAGSAAIAGYNVLLFESDRSEKILTTLPPEAQARIHHFDIADDIAKSRAAYELSVFIDFMFRRVPFWWDCRDRKFGVVEPVASVPRYRIDTTQLGLNDIIVIDSWSSLANSLMLRYNNEHNRNPLDAPKSEWDGYGWCGRMAEGILASLVAAPCHVIVIGHTDVFEKRSGDRVIDTRLIPKSTSRPHGLSLGKYFDDFLYFRAAGQKTYIETGLSNEREGGSRKIPQGTYDWEKLGFANCVATYGIRPPDGTPSAGVVYHPASA